MLAGSGSASHSASEAGWRWSKPNFDLTIGSLPRGRSGPDPEEVAACFAECRLGEARRFQAFQPNKFGVKVRSAIHPETSRLQIYHFLVVNITCAIKAREVTAERIKVNQIG
jgi:hypothetical protein